jgi:D-3-phosphoglycerate dehydrogenase / 2-oxoglutarate reductase
MSSRRLVLQTDHPWPDVAIERKILSEAGLELIEPAAGSSAADLVALARRSSAILTCWAPVPIEMIIHSEDLRIIGRIGVGVDNIDVVAARRQGVVVTNVPNYCTEEVSDHVVALVHAWARGIVFYDRDVHLGRWRPLARNLRRVSDLTVGVIGVGNIGLRVAEKFAALGCKVIGSGRSPLNRQSPIELVEIDEVARRATVVSLHLPLNDETRHIVNERFLRQMKPDALLVNTGRGPLVSTAALIDALAAGRPASAALDVVEGEPDLPPDLVSNPNVILTPHVAFSSDRSVADVRTRAAEEVVRVLSGQRPIHPVGQ